jgi:two-component system, LytTR family, response regulator
MNITAIIVDDESHARKMLKMLLSDAEIAVDVLAEAEDAKQAVSLIREYNPQVVFLDVDMPGLNGIELAELFGEDRDFEIIFVTGHKEHAPKAFRVKALDYIMKPVSPRELDESLLRLEKALQTREKPLDLSDNRIALPMLNGLELIDTNEILAFEAERAYTTIKLKHGEAKLVSKRLKLFEELLAGNENFKRVHRSYIANMSCVNRYAKAESLLILDEGVQVPVSKEHKSEVDAYFERLRP